MQGRSRKYQRLLVFSSVVACAASTALPVHMHRHVSCRTVCSLRLLNCSAAVLAHQNHVQLVKSGPAASGIAEHITVSYLCCVALAAGPNGGLAKAIADVVRPAALAAYQEAVASVFTSNAEARRKAKDAALKALDDAYALLQLYEHGLELVQVRTGAIC